MDFASWDFQNKFRERLGLPLVSAAPPRNERYAQRGGAGDGADRNLIRGRPDDRFVLLPVCLLSVLCTGMNILNHTLCVGTVTMATGVGMDEAA